MKRMLIRLVHSMLNQAIAAGVLSIMLVPPARAWSDHASLVWPLLRSQPELIHRTVAAEPLDAFLAAEQAGIAETLEAVESWSVATIEHYPPTPDDLRWGRDHPPTAERFFAAIRVNPTLPYRLYVDLSPERAQSEQAPLDWSELSFLGGVTSQLAARYWALAPGEPVSIAEVIASANDEPDFGMDIGLFTDNGTTLASAMALVFNPLGTPTSSTALKPPFIWGFTTSTG